MPLAILLGAGFNDSNNQPNQPGCGDAQHVVADVQKLRRATGHEALMPLIGESEEQTCDERQASYKMHVDFESLGKSPSERREKDSVLEEVGKMSGEPVVVSEKSMRKLS